MHHQSCLPQADEDASEILLMSCGLAHQQDDELNLNISSSCCQQSPRSISGIIETLDTPHHEDLHHEELHHFAEDGNGNVEVEITSNLAARMDSCDSFGSDIGLQANDPFTTPKRRRSLSHTTTNFPSHIPFPSPKMDCSTINCCQDENTKPAPASPCSPTSVQQNAGVQRQRTQKVMDSLEKMNLGAEQKLMRAAASVGIDSLLNAMRLHQDKDRVQRYGCASLQKLASQNGTNRAMIVDAGGVEDILTAMNRHQDKSSIQECGCMALSALLKAPDGSAAIVQFKGTEVILNAMRGHPTHAGVQKHGCLALLCLARASGDCNSYIANLGGVKDLMKALSLHRGDTGIMEYASAALSSLAYRNPKNKETIERQIDGGMSAVLEALSNYRDDGVCQQYDDLSLQSLQSIKRNRSSHGVDAILSVFVRPLQQQL
ncbi:armadillo repeat containing 6 [Seminavis robusta]|uniref:Armadillo repeat containing 6 n=1 Tax=Seminavis robusta TaxID=568900 RepID=A0A9N8HSH4_9STRA|nr:armadillo repeat containing 6 [Seminavis robusta]|eukprot:Sro1168_g248470.1 armadillo repeat containing 6 (432) ;mRNA; f:11346-12641